MKHRFGNRVMIVLALCVACVLALGATIAWAEDSPADVGGNRLTVNIEPSNSTDQTVRDDVAKVSAAVDVYLIAEYTDQQYDNHNLRFVGSYNNDDFKKAYTAAATIPTGNNANEDTVSWQTVADTAQSIKSDSDKVATGNTKEAIALPKDGIYLVLTHGYDGNVYAMGNMYKYAFMPTIVSVPNKVGADGITAVNDTTKTGTWAHDVTINAKWSWEKRTGVLTINKIVRNFSGEGATFEYHIYNTNPNDPKVDIWQPIQFTAGEQNTVEVSIPTGIDLTVTETYTGARYELTDSENNNFLVNLNEDNNYTAEVFFENGPNNSGQGGHGIENHFVYDKESGNWELTVNAIDDDEDITHKQEVVK